MATALVPKRFLRRLETLAGQQAKLRDALREFASEIEGYADDNDEAADDLRRAIDALSRQA